MHKYILLLFQCTPCLQAGYRKKYQFVNLNCLKREFHKIKIIMQCLYGISRPYRSRQYGLGMAAYQVYSEGRTCICGQHLLSCFALVTKCFCFQNVTFTNKKNQPLINTNRYMVTISSDLRIVVWPREEVVQLC